MLIETEFAAGAPVDVLWSYLLDVERVVVCMPGAELAEVVDDRTWKGRVNVKFGPVAMSFAGTVTMQERDDGAHRVVLEAKGTEQRGKGAATARVTSWLEPDPSGSSTQVKMVADITLTGAAAQMSRGLLPEVSRKLTKQFADCLEAGMTAAVPQAARTGESRPIRGIRLGLSAAWSAIVRFFQRLVGRRGTS
jgi:carbon monoxide dehydrogenase subunit G